MEDYTLMKKMRRMEALMHRLHRRSRHGTEGWHAGPHMGQGRVLALLKMQPDISQKQMSFLLDMRPQSLGELLFKLERAGFITREPSQEDRRGMNIHLTEAGAEAANEVDRPCAGDVFETLTTEEQETLSALLDKLIESLEGRLAEEGGEEGDWTPQCGPYSPRGPRENWNPRQMCGPHGPNGPHGRHGPNEPWEDQHASRGCDWDGEGCGHRGGRRSER